MGYDSYFLMKEPDVAGYVRAQQQTCPALAFLDTAGELACNEVGDGNLNYIFRLADSDGHSVIVKQAGHTLRISDEMHISVDRNRIESEILMLQDKYVPGYVPKIYAYDTVMCACIMEDLSQHRLMRTALMEHEIFPQFADWISTFMVESLLPTTDIVLDHKEKKLLQQTYVNPELCEITEDLVYTEPYNDRLGRNNVFPPNEDFVRRELYGDGALHLEVAKLKMDFMNNAQALIHGDLHTGSIFINPQSMKAFDPEFAFYGPMGYDIGNVVANMIFAWCNGDATLPAGGGRESYLAWVEDTIRDIVDLTFQKMRTAWDKLATEPFAATPGFKDWYIGGVLADTAGVTGLELNRRTVGMANVKDLTTIPDEGKRARAERICITAAKAYILQRHTLATGDDFLHVLKDAAAHS